MMIRLHSVSLGSSIYSIQGFIYRCVGSRAPILITLAPYCGPAPKAGLRQVLLKPLGLGHIHQAGVSNRRPSGPHRVPLFSRQRRYLDQRDAALSFRRRSRSYVTHNRATVEVILPCADLRKHDLSQLGGTNIVTGALVANRRIALPRFYFHTETNVRTTDEEGTEFPGYSEARREAIRTCGQMVQDAPEVFWGPRPWNVSVTDAAGLILWEIYVDGQTSAAGRSLEPIPDSIAPISQRQSERANQPGGSALDQEILLPGL